MTKNDYYFSAAENTFVRAALKDRYMAAGSWPADAAIVADAVYSTYAGNPPAGMIRGVGADSAPCWVAAPVIDIPLADRARSALGRAQQTVWADYGALGAPVPAVWIAYQRALKAIVDGADVTSTTLPDAPA